MMVINDDPSQADMAGVAGRRAEMTDIAVALLSIGMMVLCYMILELDKKIEAIKAALRAKGEK